MLPDIAPDIDTRKTTRFGEQASLSRPLEDIS